MVTAASTLSRGSIQRPVHVFFKRCAFAVDAEIAHLRNILYAWKERFDISDIVEMSLTSVVYA